MKFSWVLLTMFLLASCGGTPFDENYWEDDLSEQELENSLDGRLSANLMPLSSLRFDSGEAIVDLDGDSASLRIEMQGVPQNIMQGQMKITSAPCNSFVATPPSTGAAETRDFAYTENGTRAGLFSEQTPDDTVEGKSLVIFGLVESSATTAASALFPLACGTLTRIEDTAPTETTETTGTFDGTRTTITPGVPGFPTSSSNGFPSGTADNSF